MLLLTNKANLFNNLQYNLQPMNLKMRAHTAFNFDWICLKWDFSEANRLNNSQSFNRSRLELQPELFTLNG